MSAKAVLIVIALISLPIALSGRYSTSVCRDGELVDFGIEDGLYEMKPAGFAGRLLNMFSRMAEENDEEMEIRFFDKIEKINKGTYKAYVLSKPDDGIDQALEKNLLRCCIIRGKKVVEFEETDRVRFKYRLALYDKNLVGSGFTLHNLSLDIDKLREKEKKDGKRYRRDGDNIENSKITTKQMMKVLKKDILGKGKFEKIK